MRAYWILPNRDQKDEIPASDGDDDLTAPADSRPKAPP